MRTNFKLKNQMEDAVFLILGEMLKGKDICKCEKCKKDIMALALNNLPTKYVVTEKGEVYAKTDLLSRQFRTDIAIQVLNAIKKVSENPNHC